MQTTESLSKASLETAEQWPPSDLPKELHTIATTADLIRHENDQLYDGAAGICLGVSAFISNLLIEAKIPHKLANGYYTDTNGEEKAHWWIETASGWLLDASRGQFNQEDDRWHASVTQRTDPSYRVHDFWDPGHVTRDLVALQIKGCFGDPAEAEIYLIRCLDMHDEAIRLAEGSLI